MANIFFDNLIYLTLKFPKSRLKWKKFDTFVNLKLEMLNKLTFRHATGR